MERLSCILRLSLFFLIFVLAVSCGKKNVAEAPTELYNSAGLDSLKNELSYLAVPIELDIANIEYQINRNFSGLIYEDSSFDGDDLKFKIWKNTDLTFKHRSQGIFEFKVPLKIWVEKRVKVLGITQTPSTQFEIVADFSSKPFISSNWELKTVTNAEGFDWVTQPKLSLAGFSVPIAGIIGSVLDNYQSTIARLIDSEVASKVDLATPVLNTWNALKEPLLLSEDYNLWLQVIPVDILMTKLDFRDNRLKTAVAIKAIVNSSIGKVKIPVKKSTELPPLKFVNYLPNGFNVYLYNLITFKEAEKIAKDKFVGQKMEFRNGSRQIEVLGIKIFGAANNKIVIQINTSGDLKGTIFVKGDPIYDAKRREIILINSEFDIKTKNLLAKAASWLMEGTLVQEIESEFGIPVDPIFEEAKTYMQEFLNSKYDNGLLLKGEILEILPGRVYLKHEGLMTTVQAKGDLAVKLSNFAPKK